MMDERQQWLAAPLAEVAALVAPHRLALLAGLDGTRRWAACHHPGSLDDWARYTAVTHTALLALVGRLFACGVQTVLVPLLYPPNFARPEGWLRASLTGPHGLGRLLDGESRAWYEQWEAQPRLGGSWSAAAPWAAAALAELDGAMAAQPVGRRQVIWGCDALDPTVALLQGAGRVGADPAAITAHYYPAGPQRIHLMVAHAPLKATYRLALPTQLAGADLYLISNLPLDLSEAQIRAMLHDHLVVRPGIVADGASYDGAMLAACRARYREPGWLLGLGSVAPGGVWVGEGPTLLD